MVAGLVTASIAYFAFSLPFWLCLVIYSIVGVASALSVTYIAYLLRAPTSDWEETTDHKTAIG